MLARKTWRCHLVVGRTLQAKKVGFLCVKLPMAYKKEKYHQAAKDGYLDLLREASRKDCDSRDEVGRTPVMWSAFYGHLDALRVLLSRG